MKFLLLFSALLAFYWTTSATYTPPQVMVYTRNPGQFGRDNVLICKVANFHPPDLSIELFVDGAELPNSQLTDLTFKGDWHFYLTRSAAFTPHSGQNVTCRVTHHGVPKHYAWEPNM